MRSIDPTIPAWLDALVTRCLAARPGARYQRMKEVLAELEAGEHGGRTTAIPVLAPTGATSTTAVDVAAPATRSGTARWLIAAAAVVVLAGAAWMLSRPLVRRLTGAGGRRGADLARDPAVPQCVRRSDARFARLEPERGAQHRARAVLARAHGAVGSAASGASGSADRARTRRWPRRSSRASPTSRARGACSGASTRASATRFASTRRCRISTAAERAAERHGAERSEPLDRDRPARRRGAREPGARIVGHVSSELKATSWKPSTSSFEALRLYNEGVRLTRAGRAPGGAEEFRGGDEGGRQLRAGLLGARARLRDARLRQRGRCSSRAGR